MTRKYFLAFAVMPLLIFACKKEAGIGGKSTITGKVFVIEYSNNTGQANGNEYYAPDEKVYIRYGDNNFHDDDVDTGPDGLYKFDWLRKGNYTIFTYSECPTCESGTTSIEKSVQINDNKEVIEVNDIVIENWVN